MLLSSNGTLRRVAKSPQILAENKLKIEIKRYSDSYNNKG